MKERPILMSAPMVRAILDGTKTQTRRVVKPQPDVAPDLEKLVNQAWQGGWVDVACPFGVPGDHLWVRETWCHPAPDPQRPGDPVWYRSDFTPRYGAWESDSAPGCIRRNEGPWRPSIHMPRWASRITIEVTSVRVERLHDITEEDARAEGVRGFDELFTPRRRYEALWEDIHGAESWESNPWVWVIGFRKVVT